MEPGPLAVSLLHSLDACQFISKCYVLPDTLTSNSGGSSYLPTVPYLGDDGEEQVAMEGCCWDAVDCAEAAPPTLGDGEAGGGSRVDRAAEWAPGTSWALKWGCCFSFLLKKNMFGCAVPHLQHENS